LNAAANNRGKGRDDLTADILESAMSALTAQSDGILGMPGNIDRTFTVKKLAGDVIDSFDALRHYFQQVSGNLARVDPYLSNNAGLVSRLVDWESSWEVGSRYMQHRPTLNAVCTTISEIRKVERFAPELVQLREECDVDYFMILPRVVWLSFLENPTEVSPLLSMLLPERFNKTATEVPGEELVKFIEHFQQVRSHIESVLVTRQSTPAGFQRSSNEKAWLVLVEQAIRRPGANDQLPGSVVGEFLKVLESWSMELQRHCPHDWNLCSAVLQECVAEPIDKSTSVQTKSFEI